MLTPTSSYNHTAATHASVIILYRTPLPPFHIILVLPTAIMYHIGLLYRRRRTRKLCGDPRYDPIAKVRYPLKVMMKGMRMAWNPGKHGTIDESMIHYIWGVLCLTFSTHHRSPSSMKSKCLPFAVFILLFFCRSLSILERSRTPTILLSKFATNRASARELHQCKVE